MENITAVVLAAGKGTRMKSSKHKCLHTICGEPVILYPIKSCYDAGIRNFIIVTGNQREELEAQVSELSKRAYFENIQISYAYQEEQNGTAHAFETAYDHASENGNTQDFVIINGDSVFISKPEIESLLSSSENKMVAFSSTTLEDSKGCGRVVESDFKVEIVEEAYANNQQKLIKNINVGLYFIKNQITKEAIDFCKQKAIQRGSEEFLVDVVSAFTKDEVGINIVEPIACSNINNRNELVASEQQLIDQINSVHIQNGITIHQPATVNIGPLVKIGPDVEIYGNNNISGDSQIGSQTTILPNCIIQNAQIGEHNAIGPNSFIREGTRTQSKVKIGSFVETKKAIVGTGSKIPHLSYVGDCEIGENSNIGAGTITANYDGANKHKTIIGSNVKIGSGTTFVAPVILKDNSTTGANAVVVKDVTEGDTVVGVPAKSIKNKQN
jgi:bifunctional UDP-N-acetylglucosamine pyrophosphorylase/glucosamine-1-phosphate N-acetyltransferase